MAVKQDSTYADRAEPLDRTGTFEMKQLKELESATV